MSLLHPVILCGGSGTRLWPASRKARPKPFLPLVDEQTLFAATLARAGDPAIFAPPVVVAGAHHLADIEAQLADDRATIIVEPQARNTAAAIALAALVLEPGAIMLVCPSDHHIADVPAFRAAAAAAAALARQDWMVALGIAPTHPETGYGYIRRAAPLEGGFEVAAFIEKPDLAKATSFLADGGYSWNGGIFAFRAGAFLDELARHRPRLAQLAREAVTLGHRDGARFFPAAAPFSQIAGESVDYAVMENTARAAMVPVEMGWSDIGNWQALRDARPGDEQGNRIRGRADLVDCRNVLVQSDGPRVSVIGLVDVAVVVDGDEVLVTSMSGAQAVGKLPGAANQ